LILEHSSTVLNQTPETAEPSIRDVDRELLVAMRDGQTAGIGELTERLQVTATAIRQRIERLLEAGLIDREKSVAGRGRPTYHYCINDAGRKVIGADPSDLVQAMWEEILAIEDPQLRDLMLQRVAQRLGREYAAQLDDDAPLNERMQRLSALLASRRVSSDVISSGELPVLDIGTCPFPTLADGSTDHSMCRLEEKVLSEALGEQLQLSQCRLDGDACCQFSPAEQSVSTEQTQSSNASTTNHQASGSHPANGQVG
jgi:predicted ArsR family transcriptional regulator